MFTTIPEMDDEWSVAADMQRLMVGHLPGNNKDQYITDEKLYKGC